MKLTYALAGLALLATGAGASDMKTAANATFKLYEGDRGMCSATFLRNDAEGALFITAAHCVDGKGLNIRMQNSTVAALDYDVSSEVVYYTKTVKTLKRDDVALIQLKDKSVKIAAKEVDFLTADEAKNLEIGTPVMAVGYPAGMELTVSKGEFTAFTPGIAPLNIDGPMLRFTATVIGGNSGGGLYVQSGDSWKYVGTVNVMMRPDIAAGLIQWGTTPATIDKLLAGFRTSGKGGAEVKPGLPTAGSIDER